MQFHKILGLGLSFVAKFNTTIKQFTSQKLAKDEGCQNNIEAATMFLNFENTVVIRKMKISEMTRIPYEKQMLNLRLTVNVAPDTVFTKIQT
ncbi:MAG: hypothetical protein EZS28_025271, partial [Streblomastix strix]